MLSMMHYQKDDDGFGTISGFTSKRRPATMRQRSPISAVASSSILAAGRGICITGSSTPTRRSRGHHWCGQLARSRLSGARRSTAVNVITSDSVCGAGTRCNRFDPVSGAGTGVTHSHESSVKPAKR